MFPTLDFIRMLSLFDDGQHFQRPLWSSGDFFCWYYWVQATLDFFVVSGTNDAALRIPRVSFLVF